MMRILLIALSAAALWVVTSAVVAEKGDGPDKKVCPPGRFCLSEYELFFPNQLMHYCPNDNEVWDVKKRQCIPSGPEWIITAPLKPEQTQIAAFIAEPAQNAQLVFFWEPNVRRSHDLGIDPKTGHPRRAARTHYYKVCAYIGKNCGYQTTAQTEYPPVEGAHMHALFTDLDYAQFEYQTFDWVVKACTREDVCTASDPKSYVWPVPVPNGIGFSWSDFEKAPDPNNPPWRRMRFGWPDTAGSRDTEYHFCLFEADLDLSGCDEFVDAFDNSLGNRGYFRDWTGRPFVDLNVNIPRFDGKQLLAAVKSCLTRDHHSNCSAYAMSGSFPYPQIIEE